MLGTLGFADESLQDWNICVLVWSAAMVYFSRFVHAGLVALWLSTTSSLVFAELCSACRGIRWCTSTNSIGESEGTECQCNRSYDL